MKNLFVLILSIAGFSAAVFGQGHGISSYPLSIQQKYVSAELTRILSHGSGGGMQARYLQRLRPELVVSGGFGFSNGERENSIFAGADYELYPDYMNQPRMALRASVERAQEFGHGHTKLGLAPVISKGLSFWGKEAFPFVSIPFGLDLNSGDKVYAITSQLAVGASVPISSDGYKKLLANFEVNVNVNNAYSGVFVGFSHPLN